MKVEKEVKILVISTEALRTQLIRVGARLQFKGIVREVAFVSYRLKRERTTLRLRVVNGENELTVKNRKTASSRLLKRNEYEVTVSDFDEMARILEVLGFSKFRDREKEREEWILGDVKVEIDRYPGFPAYVEIEGKSEKAITAAIKKLELTQYCRTTETSTEFLRSLGAKDPNHIKF